MTTQPGVTTWLEDVSAHVGREPSVAVSQVTRGGRRCWAWSFNGRNHTLTIDKHCQDEYWVRVGAPGRYAEIFTTGEPVEADIRSALRFVGLLPDVGWPSR